MDHPHETDRFTGSGQNAEHMATHTCSIDEASCSDVSRMCPATDGKRLQDVGQSWPAKLLVKGTSSLTPPALGTS